MRAYKGTDDGMFCRGFQYDFTEEFEYYGDISICESGFHSCLELIDCLKYYSCDGSNRFFEVEIRGVSNDRVGDSKVVSKYIKFIREITDIKEILNGATKIPSGAFANNLTLTDIEIPDSVESIYAFAFYDCKNLTHITIPSSIKTIGGGIFLQCEKLKDITYTGTMHQWRDIKDIDWKVIHCTIHCIDGDITYP